MPERPTLRQLEYLVAVAELGGFSRAAEACGVSQPALSGQIQELERRLGLQLIERGRTGATVPPHAVPVLDAARRALRAAGEVVELAADRGDELAGPVRLAVIPTMAPYLLPAVVRELRRRHPRAEPVLIEARTDELVGMLERGDVDLGLLAAPVPSDQLAWRPIADDEFFLAMPEDHPMVGDTPLPAGVLAGLPMLLLEDGHCLRDQALEVCADVGADPITGLGAIQGTSLATLCQMVAAGQGVTLLPASAVSVEARPGTGVVVRPLRDPKPRRQVVLAWRATSVQAAVNERFAEALVEPLQSCCST